MKHVGVTKLTVDGHKEDIIASMLKSLFDKSTKVKSHIKEAGNLSVKRAIPDVRHS